MSQKASTSSLKKSAGTDRNSERNVSAQSVPRSEGHRLLLAITDSMAVVARAAGAGKTSVHRWRSGERPDESARRNLAKAYGIAVESWEQAPAAVPVAQAANDIGGAAMDAPAPIDVPESSAAHFLDLMTQVRRDRINGNLSPSERLKALEREGALRAQYERAKAADRATEELIVREHPHWARFEEELMRVLSKYPDAMREVAEAMERVR
jgi:hypothetical protein